MLFFARTVSTLGNDSFLFAFWCNVGHSYRPEFDSKSPHFNRADTPTSNRGEYGSSEGLCLVNLLCSISLCGKSLFLKKKATVKKH